MKTPEGGHKNEERGTGRASGAFPIGVEDSQSIGGVKSEAQKSEAKRQNRREERKSNDREESGVKPARRGTVHVRDRSAYGPSSRRRLPPRTYRSSGVSPLCLAIRASIRGPISSWSWKADATDGHELAGSR